MERCRHEQSCFKKIGTWWEFSCSECGLSGWGPSPDSSKREFRQKDLEKKLAAIKRKKDNGEILSRKERQILAYSTKPFGTAAGCSSCYQGVSIRG